MSKQISFESTVVNSIDGSAPVWESRMFDRSRKLSFLKGKGKILEQTAVVRKSGFWLTRIVTTGHQLEVEVNGAYTAILPLTGRIVCRVAEAETTINSGEGALLCRPSIRWGALDPVRRSTGEYLIFQFSENYGNFDDYDEIKEALSNLPDIHVLKFTDPVNTRLARYLRLLAVEMSPLNSVSVTESYLIGMSILLDECLGDALRAVRTPDKLSVPDIRDMARASAAQTIIYERFREKLHVSEIAREVGISIRSLQIAFQNTFNLTPREMIMDVRLKHIHAQLNRPDVKDQVSTVAYDNGITHLSRFSHAYREKFGESPRETLWRSQQRL